MRGASAGTAGASGYVPLPAAGQQAYMLLGDGTWGVQPTGTIPSSTGNAGKILTTDGTTPSWSSSTTALNSVTAAAATDLTLAGGTAGTNAVKVTNTTAATNTTSGALQVAGGVGVAGAGYFGGNGAFGPSFTPNAWGTGGQLDVNGTTGGILGVAYNGTAKGYVLAEAGGILVNSHAGGTAKFNTSGSGATTIGNSAGVTLPGQSNFQSTSPQIVFGVGATAVNQIGFLHSSGGQYVGLSGNRNPNSGVFANTAGTHAGIDLDTGAGGSSITFRTTATPNTLGTVALTIASNQTATFSGDVALSTAGKTVSVKSGTNALAGTVTLASGAGTITSSAIDVNTVIVMSIKTLSGSFDHAPSVIVSAGSATIDGHNADNSTYNWVALKVS